MREKVKTLTTDVKSFLSAFYDLEKIKPYCEACGNYASFWSCPPFDFEPYKKLSAWNKVTLISVRVDYEPIKRDLRRGLAEVKEKVEQLLLLAEMKHGGLACGFSGFCSYCLECSRKNGDPCRFPEKVRPALEAYGIDVNKVMEELLDIKLEWKGDNTVPRYLHLVGALFHN